MASSQWDFVIIGGGSAGSALGNRLSADSSNRVVVARVEPHTTAQVGERAVLKVDTRRLHLFDVASGLALH